MPTEFILSKTLPEFALPLGFTLALILLALIALLRNRKRFAGLTLLLGFLILWSTSTPHIANRLLHGIEALHPPVAVEDVDNADVIVVLGGGIASIHESGSTNLGEAFDRLYQGWNLYRAGKARFVLLSGGAPKGRRSEANVAAAVLRNLGVPNEAIILERKSRNTIQNAANTAALMHERNFDSVLLVTSASHMRRAVAIFTDAGVPVIPFPVDYQYNQAPEEIPIRAWLPDSEALNRSNRVLREYLGYWYYKFMKSQKNL